MTNLQLTRRSDELGTDWPTYERERPGMSAFALEDGVVYHTYSTYARGLDVAGDLTLTTSMAWMRTAPGDVLIPGSHGNIRKSCAMRRIEGSARICSHRTQETTERYG